MDNIDKKLTLLEYNESTGQFHYNAIVKGTFFSKPNTNGWDAIAVTQNIKAGIFCDSIRGRINKRYENKQEPFKTSYIKEQWKIFCFIFNEVIDAIDTDDLKDEVARNFHNNFGVTLQSLGVANTDYEGVKDCTDYNPLDYISSNYYTD